MYIILISSIWKMTKRGVKIRRSTRNIFLKVTEDWVFRQDVLVELETIIILKRTYNKKEKINNINNNNNK